MVKKTTEYVLMGAACALAFCVYCHTLCTGVYPGASAVATAQALNLLPGAPVTHPVWLAAARAVAALPVIDLPFRLNLFSALCASLSVALVFRIARRVLFELIRPYPALRMIPVSDESPQGSALAGGYDMGVTVEAEGEGRELLFATLSAAVCTLAYAFSAPVWLSATALHAQAFDVLLLLLAADFLFKYAATARLGFCVAGVALCGLAASEAPALALLSAALGVFILRACIRFDHLSESFLLLLLASGLTGFAGGLALYWLCGLGASAGVFTMLTAFAGTYRASLAGLFASEANLILAVLVPGLALLMAFVGVRTITFCKDEVAQWKWRLMGGLNVGYTVACLLGVPGTVWALARATGGLPVLPSLVVAWTAGLLALYGLQLATAQAYDADYAVVEPPLWRRIAGYGLCGLLVVVSLRAAGRNVSDADGRRALFADAVAEEVLSQAAGASWLVTDGNLDVNVLVRAHLARRSIEVLPARPTPGADPAAAAGRLPRLVRASGATVESAVADWLHGHPADRERFAVVGSPEVWSRAGFEAVPFGLLYAGVERPDRTDLSALFAMNRIVWSEVEPLVRDEPSLLPSLRAARAGVRAHLSRLANETGVALDRARRWDEASAAYGAALDLDPANLCAAANRAGLPRRSGSRPDALAASAPAPLPGGLDARVPTYLERHVARYGTLVDGPADALLAQALVGGCGPAVRTSGGGGPQIPGSSLAALSKRNVHSKEE